MQLKHNLPYLIIIPGVQNQSARWQTVGWCNVSLGRWPCPYITKLVYFKHNLLYIFFLQIIKLSKFPESVSDNLGHNRVTQCVAILTDAEHLLQDLCTSNILFSIPILSQIFLSPFKYNFLKTILFCIFVCICLQITKFHKWSESVSDDLRHSRLTQCVARSTDAVADLRSAPARGGAGARRWTARLAGAALRGRGRRRRRQHWD